MANAWQAHIKEVAKKNPGMKFKDVLKLLLRLTRRLALVFLRRLPREKLARKERRERKARNLSLKARSIK